MIGVNGGSLQGVGTQQYQEMRGGGKNKGMKRLIEEQRAKPRTSILAINVLIGNEE